MDKTLFDVYSELKKYGSNPSLADKNPDGTYSYLSYHEMLTQIDLFARGMIAKGIEKGEKTAILAENSRKHTIADLANILAGCVTVPLYTTYTPQKVGDILADSGAKQVILSSEKQYEKIEPLEKKLGLKNIIFLEGCGKHDSFEGVIEKGYYVLDDEFDERVSQVQPSDTALIMYTSGTTGKPKGVMITHRNITSNVDATKNLFDISPRDRALSILPYGHAFEHTGELILMMNGVSIAYSKMDIINEMGIVKPTVLMAVPSLYEKIIEKINLKLDKSPAKKFAFRAASFMKSRGMLEEFLAHTIFKDIYGKMGGALRLCIVGGGPLNEETEKFFAEVLGIPLYNGYGTSETSPVISVNTKKFHRYRSVGKPLSNLEVKILDGEIIASGPSVTEQGYYRDQEKTSAVLKEINGKKFYFTGDKGGLDKEGYLYIHGRMQNDIRLSTGQNLGLAEELEEPLKGLRCVEDLMIHGHAEKYISSLIVPNFSYLRGLSLEEDIDDALLARYSSLKDLTPEHEVSFNGRKRIAANKNVYNIILNEINAKNEEMGLEDYARLKKFVLLPCGFSEANPDKGFPELLTPTKKIKRKEVLVYYKPFFDMMYKK